MLQCRDQVINQLIADGIAFVRAIERDGGDAAGFGIENGFVIVSH